MNIFIEKENKTKKISFKGRASNLLKTLNINKETIILIRNNEVVTEDESLKDSDDIKILSVISGG